MNRKQKIFLFAAAIAHLFILIVGMVTRFADGDEGGMLLVSREVIGGRVPILEINAHNQPLMYYFYGLWMKVFGFNILSARSLSILAIFGAGLLLVWLTYRFSRSFLATVIVYFLYITNLTFFKANIPVKPFALSNFFIFASFAVLACAYLKDRSLKAAPLFASGLLLGASLGIRFIFSIPFAFGVWFLWVLYKDRERVFEAVKKIAFFAAGVLVPLLPSIWIFIKEPLRAYTIWGGAYAQIYFGKGNNPDFLVDYLKDTKGQMTMAEIFSAVKVPDTAFLIVLVLLSTAFYFIKMRRSYDMARNRVYLLSWLVFCSILWVYSNLYANFVGYVNQLVLMALVLSLPLVESVSSRFDYKKLIAAAVIFLTVITGLLYFHYQKRLNTSIFYMFRSNDIIITPAFVDHVSENIVKKLTKENEPVLDVWGVFAFASGRPPVEGYEYPTDSALFWKLMPDKQKARKYLYISQTELLDKIEKNEFPLVILHDPNELHGLLGRRQADDNDFLREKVEAHYNLYEKYFVKPTNAWVLIYVPKRSVVKEPAA